MSQVSGSNVVVYRNTTSVIHRVTITVSGRAEIEVRTADTSGPRHFIDDEGITVSLEVPSGHHIEVDAKTPTRIVEVTIIEVNSEHD